MSENAAIARVLSSGKVTLLTARPEALDGFSLDARFSQLGGMAFDNANNLIVTDEGAHQVRKISPRGDVTTIAGAGESEPFNSPTGIAIDQATGLIYIADTLQNVIRTFDPATNKIDVFAGAVGKRENSDGPRLSGAAFKSPGSLAFYGGSSGVLYVLDSLHDSYLMRNFEDKTTSKVGDRFARIAGLSKSNGGGRVETLATATEDDYQYPFNFAGSTSGLAVGPDGTVYIADFYNQRIVKYTEQMGAVRFANFPYLFPAGILAAAFPEPSLLVATQFVFATPLARISLSSGAQSGTLLSMPGVVGFGSRDGIFDLNDNDGGAALAPFFLASNSNGTVFVGHRKHNKVMRIGLLRGAACNLSIPAHSPQHVCSPGTYVDWDSFTCRACQDSLSRDTFPFSSYCMNAAGNAVSGGTVTTSTAQGASHTNDTATEVGLWFAILLIAGVAGLLVAYLIVRRTRSLDALHRRPGQDEAMSVLVSSINLVQRESFRGLSPLSMAATMQAAASSNTAAAGSASASSAGAAAAVPASANVSSLAFTDLLPDAATLPLFGGFGVVFSARWVSRGGLRVAVKVPKDLVVSGYLPPAAAAELVKEAQGLVRASDNLANEFVVRLFGVAQGDGGAAWAAACERARALHFARKSGSSDSATIAESDPGAASASAAPTPAAGFHLLGLVMAFEEGGTLADQLQPPPSLLRPAWPASMADRLRVARELVQGLWHLHRVGIVHGDLKLENVSPRRSTQAKPPARCADRGLPHHNRRRRRRRPPTGAALGRRRAPRAARRLRTVGIALGRRLGGFRAEPRQHGHCGRQKAGHLAVHGAGDVPRARPQGARGLARHGRLCARHPPVGGHDRLRALGRVACLSRPRGGAPRRRARRQDARPGAAAGRHAACYCAPHRRLHSAGPRQAAAHGAGTRRARAGA